MDDSKLESIFKYRRASERVATAGQPTEEQVTAIAEAGCKTVINLGLHDADYALPDERSLVESLGMEYIHIPVQWDRPTRGDLMHFCDAIEDRADRDMFVHCAANVRVSVFVALDRVYRQGWPARRALKQVSMLSLPKVWREFIDEIVHERKPR